MIESLNKLVKKDNKSTEVKEDLLNYFNKRLISSDNRKFFNEMYDKYYKCYICYDVIFDPVYCPDCHLVFCKNCIQITSTSNITNIKCLHTKPMEPLHDNEKYIFEQIKIDCFFNCSNKNLSLLNYASHLESCLGREIIKREKSKK